MKSGSVCAEGRLGNCRFPNVQTGGSGMKRTSITLIGFTTLVAPRIAPAQNAVIDWNSIAVTTALAGISFIPPNTPNGMALYLGYVHRAMNDAVNAIEHRFKPYGPAIAASAAA